MKTITLTIDLSNVSTKEQYNAEIAKAVEGFSSLEDKFFKTQVINGLKEQNAGNKGRISVPDFMKKEKEVVESTGKKGRPALSAEEKLAKMQAKYEAEKAKLEEQARQSA